MRSLVFYVLVFFMVICITGLLIQNLEGFANPFEEIIKQLQEKKGGSGSGSGSKNPLEELVQQISAVQQEGQAYDKWIGYVYKHAPNNSKILDDFKARVFQPSCKFRTNWATNLPEGMGIPNPASSSQLANVAYKNYMECLTKGKPTCLQQLENARVRFMEPGTCQFLNPPDVNSYTKDYRVSFH